MWLLISEHHCYRLSSASLECESWQVSNTIRKKSVKKKKKTQHNTTLGYYPQRQFFVSYMCTKVYLGLLPQWQGILTLKVQFMRISSESVTTWLQGK